ncbi:MAG TPA: PilZ domain-containing protein [Myxococcota bacterium]|nr:PilZ domain-containing protein [Myxococcota bacterium]HRY93506.1 PilZ domain-containing protein [Myxococcota bacterium]HSA21949.1 PilZ domain-containing protein [Myxococcota bacterium]
MDTPSQARKRVATFDPEHRSRVVIRGLLERLGFEVDEHKTDRRLENRLTGEQRADLVFLHLRVLGADWPAILARLEGLRLKRPGLPPVLAVSSLPLQADAADKLRALGCSEVLSREAHLLEVMFAFNRLLFPKIRELRRYTRVFGGFAIHFRAVASPAGPWREGLVYNLSREGAFIQCEGAPVEGARLQVRFVLPGDEAPMEAEAVVSWVNPPSREADPLSPPGLGVNFLTLTEAHTENIARFLDAHGDEPAEASEG